MPSEAVASAAWTPSAPRATPGIHPNEVDAKRIERALTNRKRYRYVSPSVQAVEGGYLIASPCCSRNVDPDGGTVDVALLQFVEASASWFLYRKDHGANEWLPYAAYDRLADLLEQLNVDPQRLFWQ